MTETFALAASRVDVERLVSKIEGIAPPVSGDPS